VADRNAGFGVRKSTPQIFAEWMEYGRLARLLEFRRRFSQPLELLNPSE
jgi:hypothetical protein